MATTWNPSDLGANITLSNGNLTAAFGSGAYTSVRSTNSPAKTTGKWHAEFTINVDIGDNPLVGIMDGSANLSSYAGNDPHGSGMDLVLSVANDVYVFNGGTAMHPFPFTPAQGDVIALEVDIDNGLGWWQDVTQGTGWTNSDLTMTGNPGAGTGGIAFTASPTGGIMLAGSGWDNMATITLNPGPTFSGTVSSGFSPWDAAAATVPWGWEVAGPLIVPRGFSAAGGSPT